MKQDAADNSIPREISALLSNERLILRETQRAVVPLGGVISPPIFRGNSGVILGLAKISASYGLTRSRGRCVTRPTFGAQESRPWPDGSARMPANVCAWCYRSASDCMAASPGK
jgi:hypothetical protein